MRIAVGCDHTAVALKQELIAFVEELGFSVRDFGVESGASCHYPEIAEPVCRAVAAGECALGLLICGTGVGMSLAANKVTGIRCAVCSESYSAEMTRRHNDANVLAVGARVVGSEVAKRIVQAFLSTPFEGGRHQTRVDMIMDMEKRSREGTL